MSSMKPTLELGQFMIEIQVAIHNGGTKFYRTLSVSRLEPASRRVISTGFTNWGPVSKASGKPPSSFKEGQKIHHAVGDVLAVKRREKASRGYGDWTIVNNIYDSREDLAAVLSMLGFNAFEVGQITFALRMTSLEVPEVDDREEPVFDPIPKRETVSIETAAQWGTW